MSRHPRRRLPRSRCRHAAATFPFVLIPTHSSYKQLSAGPPFPDSPAAAAPAVAALPLLLAFSAFSWMEDPPPQKKEVSIERQYDWSNFLFRLCPRAFLLPVSIPSLPPGAPPRASVRPVYAPGAILIWSVELGPWTRSTDGQRSDLTTPHSFHHFILSGGGRWRRPDATKFLLLSPPRPPTRPRNPSLSLTESGATEARERGGRGKASWLLFQFRIHPEKQMMAMDI